MPASFQYCESIVCSCGNLNAQGTFHTQIPGSGAVPRIFKCRAVIINSDTFCI